MWNPLRRFLYLVAGAMARFGLLDRNRAEQSADLAWPQMVTALARQSRRTADLAMVGIAFGPSAVAGLGFAYTYWLLVGGLAVGTSGGTISLVSQRYGAQEYREIGLVVKQSVLVAVALSIPLTGLYWGFADELIGVLGADPTTLEYSSTYLHWLSLSILLKFLNIIAARTLIGADDAWTPMVFRVVGGIFNVLLNAVLIFGVGMGVTGAALGTVCATGAITLCFAWGLVRGRVPGVGAFPVQVRLGRPFLDRSLLRDLVDIAFPLVIRRVGGGIARFPFIALVAHFGPIIVAAYTVSRRMRGMVKAASDGFGAAASSLVGQELGGDQEGTAEAYGWDILRFSIGVQVLTGVVLAVFARPIARVFVQTPVAVEATVPFIWVVMVAVIGVGIDATATGTLRAGGDTRWPMYGRLLGRYTTIPVVYLGIVTPLGVGAVYLSLLVETFVPASVTFHRFQTGKWKVISRSYRPDASD
jgi:putative MATE family efflux protein